MNYSKTNSNQIIEQLNFFMDTVKSDIVKTRESNYNPKTGIYLEDKELMDSTVFKPGVKFRYALDKDNKVLKIMPSDIGTSVALRSRNGKDSSVIHVRRKEILEVFKDYNKFECQYCGVIDADINAAHNIEHRYLDGEITLYTPYVKVKEILLKRQNQKQLVI